MSKKETKMHQSSLVEKRVKEIKRRTRKKYNTEEKIRIVLEGLKGESSIGGLCRRQGINQNTLLTQTQMCPKGFDDQQYREILIYYKCTRSLE